MIILVFFLSTSLSIVSGATAEIYSVVTAANAEDKPHLVKLTNGRVLFLSDLELSQWNERRAPRSGPLTKSTEITPTIHPGSFNPTVVLGYSAAERLFNNLNKRYRQNSITQCYNRAHVWAYEEFRKSGLHSQKSFIFFSDDFILENKFEWWFHVAPSVLVDEDGDLELRVLDHQFADRPLTLREWTGTWVKDRHCPFINKYSHFSGKKKDEDCYLMNVPMFFWQPRDLEALEATGFAKTQFVPWELQHAYQEAFNR